MTAATSRLSARRRAVHAACRQLGMDDDTRHEMLQNLAGVRSTTLLSIDACDTVLDHLRRAGAALNPKKRNVGQHPGTPESCRPGAVALMSKIEALLADMQLPWAYAAAILKHVSGIPKISKSGVDALEWATPDHLHKVVAALTYEQQKRDLLSTVDNLLSGLGKARSDADILVSTKFPNFKKVWTRDKNILIWLANHLADKP